MIDSFREEATKEFMGRVNPSGALYGQNVNMQSAERNPNQGRVVISETTHQRNIQKVAQLGTL